MKVPRVPKPIICAAGAVLLTSLSSVAFVSRAPGMSVARATPQPVAVPSECDMPMTLPEVVVRAGRG